jgi:acyl-CoA thioesterase-1
MRRRLILPFAVVLLLASCAAEAREPVRIVCLGDSVTKAVRPGVSPEETFSALLERQLNGAGIPTKVTNSGVGGDTTTKGLARFDRDVLAHQPHYVVLMFGLNDSWIDDGQTTSRLTAAEYRDNLLQMIQTLRARNVQVVLMTPNPALAPKYDPERNVTLRPYVEATRELAATQQIPLVDVYSHFAELGLEGVPLNTLFTDGMHPNPAGQKIIADLLAAQFQTRLAKPR